MKFVSTGYSTEFTITNYESRVNMYSFSSGKSCKNMTIHANEPARRVRLANRERDSYNRLKRPGLVSEASAHGA